MLNGLLSSPRHRLLFGIEQAVAAAMSQFSLVTPDVFTLKSNSCLRFDFYPAIDSLQIKLQRVIASGDVSDDEFGAVDFGKKKKWLEFPFTFAE